MPGGWRKSDRAATLPTNWPKLREAIRKRDGYQCTWITDGRRCTGPADEVDHEDRHGGDDPSNLRSLCTPHHAQKSAAEGVEARRAIAAQRYRPQEQHPGLIS